MDLEEGGFVNPRLQHILRNDGRAVIIPIDHTMSLGLAKGWEKPEKTLAAVIEGGPRRYHDDVWHCQALPLAAAAGRSPCQVMDVPGVSAKWLAWACYTEEFQIVNS